MLIPPNNSTTDPCFAVHALDAERPHGTAEYNLIQLVLGSIVSVLFLLVIPLLYVLRNDPMFFRIRYFSLNAVYCLLSAIYCIVAMLPESQVIEFSCTSLLLIHALGATATASAIWGRTLVFVVETKYHLLLLELNGRDGDNNNSSQSESLKNELGYLQALWTTFKLGSWLIPLEAISLTELANIRRRYSSIIIASGIPPLCILTIGFAALPIYRSACMNCFIFVEFVFIVALSQNLSTTMVVRFVKLANDLNQDEQRVLVELKWLLSTASGPFFFGYFLFHLFDPGNLAYERVFNWHIIVAIVGPLLVWFWSYLVPVCWALQFRARRNKVLALRKLSRFNKQDFTALLEADTALKQKFYEFAAARYCMESVNFLQDYRAYKIEVGLQSDKWLRAKAKRMVHTYVEENADQEINVGESLKAMILTWGNLEACSGSELHTLFDRVGEDVLSMMYSNLWVDFEAKIGKRKLTMVAVEDEFLKG